VPSEKYNFAEDMAPQLTGDGSEYFDSTLISRIRARRAKIRQINERE
jgi:hypothetical protein